MGSKAVPAAISIFDRHNQTIKALLTGTLGSPQQDRERLASQIEIILTLHDTVEYDLEELVLGELFSLAKDYGIRLSPVSADTAYVHLATLLYWGDGDLLSSTCEILNKDWGLKQFIKKSLASQKLHCDFFGFSGHNLVLADSSSGNFLEQLREEALKQVLKIVPEEFGIEPAIPAVAVPLLTLNEPPHDRQTCRQLVDCITDIQEEIAKDKIPLETHTGAVQILSSTSLLN